MDFGDCLDTDDLFNALDATTATRQFREGGNGTYKATWTFPDGTTVTVEGTIDGHDLVAAVITYPDLIDAVTLDLEDLCEVLADLAESKPMTGFDIIDGVPHVNGHPFPWAYEVNDNTAYPDWPWVGFSIRIEAGWELHAQWRRHGAGADEPDGATANVSCTHGDAAFDAGSPTPNGIPTHILDARDLATPDWFLDLYDRACRNGPQPEHDLRLHPWKDRKAV